MQKPPVAKKIHTEKVVLGITMLDDYAWLKDRENPDTLAYLEAENQWTEEVLAPTKEFQDTLYKEMLSRIKETDLSVPQRKGSYLYYTRTVEGLSYAIHCRKKNEANAPEEILIDENKLAEGLDYFNLGDLKISPDEKLAAYSFDSNGSEDYVIKVLDLSTKTLYPDQVNKASAGIVWASDNKNLFYITLDAAHRPFKCFRHELGSTQADDEVYEEKDESFFLGIGKTLDQQYLTLESHSKITSEIQFLDANDPKGKFQMVSPRTKGVEYSLTHHEGWFYIVTNLNAVNFRVVKAQVTSPSSTSWLDVIPHDFSSTPQGVTAFKDHLLIEGRKNGLTNLAILNLRNKSYHDINFDEPVYTVWTESNPEYNTNILRFTFTSFLTPISVFDYNLETKARELKKQNEVLGGYDRKLYHAERITAIGNDGAKIPISLFYKKGVRNNGPAPLLLYGYGSYGHSSDPWFNSNRLSLVDRGIIYAIAHVRGGGEMGRTWYEDGKFLFKKNTFNDFIRCAEHLITSGLTSSNKIAAIGGSAGGLLMGAIINLRPDLFHSILAHVPFVDVANTMLDPEIPLTVTEYDEWGNPNEEKYFSYMYSYSPYDHVSSTTFPHLLITAGLNDPRVGYWEPAKWCAKMRELNKGENMLLLKTHMGAGHQGASGRYGQLKDVALDYAFIILTLTGKTA